MKEFYIRDKVMNFLGKPTSVRRIQLIEKNALIASIMNEMSKEIDIAVHDASMRIFDKLHTTLREKV